MGHSSLDDHELSNILDNSLTEQQKQTRSIFTELGQDFNAFQQRNATPEEVLEKSHTDVQKRTGQILRAIFNDFKAFQKKEETTQEHLLDISLSKQHEQTVQFIPVTDKEDKSLQKKEEKSLPEQQKQNEPIFSVTDEDLKSLLKKEGHLFDKSPNELQEQIEQVDPISEEESEASQESEKETSEHLYVLGNVLLGVLTLGITHAIFYLGSLIAYGSQFQKWESKDPITWFFHRVNASIVIKQAATKLVEEVDEEEDSVIVTVSASG